MIEKVYSTELIDGKNIVLKRLDESIAEVIFKAIDEDRKHLREFVPWPHSLIKSLQDEIEYIQECNQEWDKFNKATFGIFLKSGEYMGNVEAVALNWNHHSLEIAYWLLGKFEGHGYITEAVSLLEKQYRNIGMNRFAIKCDPNNKKSASVATRLSYKREGTFREVFYQAEKYVDLEVYSKIRSDC